MKYKWLLFLIIPISAFADESLMSNVQNGCSSTLNNDTYLFATFTPNQYQCSSGYYVPANNDGCVICPEYYNCSGGNFTFNENYDQGNKFKTQISENITNGCKTDFLKAINNTSNIIATFAPNEHTCSSGYYLPANVDECTLCPAGSACSGGTYTFNETTDQGIQSCAPDTSVPAGFAICSPHRLHVGDDVVYTRSTKLTTPSLNIQIGNDIFYVNMTTTRTRMNKDSEHYFHAQWENNDYYICDDTTCPQ